MYGSIIPINVKLIFKQISLSETALFAEVTVGCIGYVTNSSKTPGEPVNIPAWSTSSSVQLMIVGGKILGIKPAIDLIVLRHKILHSALPAMYKKAHNISYLDHLRGSESLGYNIGPPS